MNNFVRRDEGVTKLRIVLPVSREKVWPLVATSEGLGKWFPQVCEGKIAKGEVLEFFWPSGNPDKFRVLEFAENRHWEMEWCDGATVRYSIEGDSPVLFTLEAKYPQTSEGRSAQIQEVAGWSLHLAVLKSRVLGGPDLRNTDTRFTWKDGFID